MSLHQRAERLIPGGVNSNVRFEMPRVFFRRGEGCRLWDVDGNEYVDYILGQGPAFLGHAPREVVELVEEASRRGVVYAAQHPLEVEAAELLTETLGWPDMVRLGSTGTEAVQTALRLARAHTGRNRIIRFHGHYHGWLDNIMTSADGDTWGPASAGQPPGALDDLLELSWNDFEVLEEAFQRYGPEIAGVIAEPVMFNAGAISPRDGYLERLRSLCDEYDAVLVFDEVISGFRLALGGAVERFGVVPDIATYGKALGSGWPVAAIAGRGDIMSRVGTGNVNHSGTFNGNVMSSAAVVATLRRLRDDPPYKRVEEVGTKLMTGLRQAAQDASVPLRLQGYPAAFHASLGEPGPIYDLSLFDSMDREGYRELAHRMADAGVWVSSRGTWFVSAAHDDGDVEETLERLGKVLDSKNPT